MNEDKTISRDSKLKIKLRTSEAKRVVAVRELRAATRKLRELESAFSRATVTIKILSKHLEEYKEEIEALKKESASESPH